MRVAVTGGSGVVGSAVVRHLVEAGHEVRALARSQGASAHLDDLGAAVVHGDLFDEAALGRLMKGTQWVFHVAGVNEMCLPDPAPMWRVNVDGALTALEAAREAGVKRLIHTSSAATIGEERGTVGVEDTKHRGHFLSEYERSKTVGERLVLDRAGDLEVVSVNPSSVQGPGRSTGTGALLLAAARGRLPVAVDSTFSMVDIDDCARGHLLAAERGVPGERYLLSGAVVSVRETLAMLAHLMGNNQRPWFLRPEAVTGLAPVAEVVSRMLGKQPPLCPESARVLLHGHRYDGSRATRDLGLEYTAVEETLGRLVAWFRESGLLD